MVILQGVTFFICYKRRFNLQSLAVIGEVNVLNYVVLQKR